MNKLKSAIKTQTGATLERKGKWKKWKGKCLKVMSHVLLLITRQNANSDASQNLIKICQVVTGYKI